jgi:sec-independent protein translocase protein TatC
VSIYVGFVLALPIVLWQLWLFFAPAVDPIAERKVFGLAVCALALAAGGIAFGYWVLLPRAVHFLVHYDHRHFLILPRASSYYNFVVTVLVGIVIVFQTPLVVLGLVYLGVLSSRTLRRQRRMGYLVTAAIALALPGPDPVTTFLELLPMWALFEGSIWLAFFFERRQAKAAPASATLGG